MPQDRRKDSFAESLSLGNSKIMIWLLFQINMIEWTAVAKWKVRVSLLGET